MPGKKCDVRILRTIRHWNSGVGRAGNRGRNAGNNFESQPGIDAGLRFLSSTTKDERITTLEPNDLFTRAREINQELVDLFLAQGLLARPFSRVNNFSIVSRPIEHRRIRERIVNNRIGPFDALFRTQRNQTEIARSGTDEVDLSFGSLAFVHSKPCLFCMNLPEYIRRQFLWFLAGPVRKRTSRDGRAARLK